MESVALTAGEGKLVSTVVTTASGKTFDLGVPGTPGYDKRLRRMIGWRMRHEPAFREAFRDRYDFLGRTREGA